ncbi:MAG: serine/threonine-protein phosphatase [Solirubrobacterales bacterium]|nr:serine/threonine-protein phosphatase [Solirubrobacterales bacterium]
MLPAQLPERLVALAEDATAGPVGLYVVDIEGFRLAALIRPAGFPADFAITAGLGPEIGPAGLAELAVEVEHALPGAVVAPLWVRGRATAVLVATQDPHGAVAALARDTATSFELASGYTDVIDRARRVRRASPAAEVQQDLLVPRMAAVAGGEVAGSLLPAYDVGGDWFDHADNPEGAWLSVADAMGKGPRAAAVSALALAALRGARRSGDSLEECCLAVHEVVEQVGVEQLWFITAVLANWHAPSQTLSWVCCGHPSPLLISAAGDVEELDGRRTLPLGLTIGKPRTFERNQRALTSGDRVLFYSDGITERRTPGGRFGLEGLIAAVRETTDTSAAATVSAIERVVLAASTDRITDDATQLVLRVQ